MHLLLLLHCSLEPLFLQADGSQLLCLGVYHLLVALDRAGHEAHLVIEVLDDASCEEQEDESEAEED